MTGGPSQAASPPLRVQIIGPFPPPLGGVQTNITSICNELDAAGHRWEGVSVPRSRSETAATSVRHPRGRPDRLIRYLRESGADITHVHVGGDIGLKAIAIMLLVVMFARGKRVLTFHSGGFVMSSRGRNPRRAPLLRWIFRSFDRVICVNSAMLEMFRKYGVADDRCILIYPYNLESPDPTAHLPRDYTAFASRHEKLIVTVGLLESEYDIPLQINALEHILASHPSTGLVIIGGGSLEAELKSLVQAREYRPHIHLAGETERRLVLRMIEDADLVLRTTLYDGDAISVREAMHLGKHVIATDNGMRPKGIQTIPVGDMRALIDAANTALHLTDSPPAYDQELGGNSNIAAVVKLYESLADARPVESPT